MTHGNDVALAIAGGSAFVGVFSVFLAAFLVLAIVTLRWAVRRDRVGRAEWIRRKNAERHDSSEDRQPGSPTSNGRRSPQRTRNRNQGRGSTSRRRPGPFATR